MDNQTIENIVQASGVMEGELVLVHFWGENSHKELADQFMCAVAAMHATPVLLQQSRMLNSDLFEVADQHCFDERYFDLLSHFDAVIDVFTYRPVVLGRNIKESQMSLYRRYMSKLFPAFMKSKRFTQIRIPTVENAQESGLDVDDFIQRMEQAYAIDYSRLKTDCMRKIEMLKQHSRLVLHTGEHDELHFSLMDREWQVDAGDGDMPCGEVFIAPLEDQTHGSVYFEDLYLEDVGHFKQVTLQVEQGKIVSADNPELDLFVKQLQDADRVVCELGLGMNPQVTSLCGYPVLDEKMANTFHIAIGMNDMFGGSNHAALHLDMVGCGLLSNEEGMKIE